jgi:drug/metabolite transporter (DMT)-like permease
MERSPAKGVLLAVCASVLWGTVPIAGTVALRGIGAGALSALRLLLATLFLFALLRWRRTPLARPSPLVLFAAFCLAVNHLAYMWGLDRAGPATSQILIQTAPLFLVALGVAVLGERLRRRQLAGGAVALLGVFLVAWEPGAASPRRSTGVLLILLAALGWAVYAAAHSRIGRASRSGPSIMWIFLFTGLFTLPVAAVETARRPDGVQAAAIAYLCVNTVLAYWSFAECVRHIHASVAAVILTLQPVVTMLLLVALNAVDQTRVPYEALTVWKVGGAGLVVTGVAVTVSARR